jgi:peptide-methionine (S)-S-oxide reductase
MNMQDNLRTITLGNGCFWCTEAIFSRLKGVSKVISGYSGGHLENPDYKSVCEGNTGHAECLQITYDPEIISLDQLLDIFWKTHDPTTLNRQGNDIGTQYRSVIFYQNQDEYSLARKKMETLQQSGRYTNSVVTTIEPLKIFYPAENYHQQYFEYHDDVPYCHFSIKPKVEKFEKEFKEMLK